MELSITSAGTRKSSTRSFRTDYRTNTCQKRSITLSSKQYSTLPTYLKGLPATYRLDGRQARNLSLPRRLPILYPTDKFSVGSSLSVRSLLLSFREDSALPN